VAAAQLARLGIHTEPLIDAPPTAPRAPVVAAVEAEGAPTTPHSLPVASPPRAPAQRAPRLPEVARIGDRVLLPDLRGLSVEEVRKITAKHGLAVEVSGNGRAIAQEPPPGTVVAVRGARIHVRFSAPGGRI
jgi:hypothetical protein